MVVDTHCHLNFKSFSSDLPEVITRAKEIGISKIIIPGARISSSMKAVSIASHYDQCFASIGIHPHHVHEYIHYDKSKLEQNFRHLMTNNKVKAIGEIGLDYHKYNNYPSISREIIIQQRELLIYQINLAISHNLPIIFHCREAYDDLINLIITLNKTNKKLIKGVIHCFEGNLDFLNRVLDLGLMVGYDGNITYKNNAELRKVVSQTPLDRILTETDAPYLTPEPLRGGRNEPSYIIHTISCLSGLFSKSVKEIEKITYRNALKLFNL